MAEPLGFAHYRDSYSTEQLWDMLITQGNPTSVELSAAVWATARGKLATTREALNANVTDLVDHWRGPASEEFQNRTLLIIQYSAATESYMQAAEQEYLPGIAAKLASAQARARGDNQLGEDLNPANDIPELEEWLEQVKGLSRADVAGLTSNQWVACTNEHTAWREDRHDELAEIIADLGAEYAAITQAYFAEPLPREPEGMPGGTTFERPATGVFAETPADSGRVPVIANSAPTEPVFYPDEDDEDELAGSWNFTSHDDFDEPSGGLAAGGTAVNLPGAPSTYGAVPTSGGTALPPGTNTLGAGGFGPGPVSTRSPGATGSHGPLPPGQRPIGAASRGAAGRTGATGPVHGRRNADDAEEEETAPRESKYVKAEDVFSAPFDRAVGPAHDGPKHQRAWDKEHDAWEERRRETED
ncbi:hypothetical protein GCM10009830_24540 [Glycomyces endophyticus]|uniref:PPE family domain-containing protein n=1 Tax=Glycomyces endophyticus TaxID=480996 RepID=A0ABN2GUW7_9ACTN